MTTDSSTPTPLPPTSTTSTTPPSIGVLGEPITGTLISTGVKPGRMTSEFIVTMLIIAIGSTLASGVIVNNTAIQLAGVAMTVLKAIAYTWSRTAVKTAAMLVLVMFAFHSTGCGASANFDTRIQTVVTGVTYAQLAANQFDTQHEKDIALSCGNGITDPVAAKADCTAKVAAYRAELKKFNEAFDAAVAAIKAVVKLKNDQTVAGAEAAALIVAQELAALGVKL